MTPANYECIHEEVIQDHSLHLATLDEKSRWKEKTIMDIQKDIKEVKAAVKELTEQVNKVVNNSMTSDLELEKRVETLETKIDAYEKFLKDKKNDENNRTSNQLATLALIMTGVGIIVGVIIKFI